MIGRWSDAGRDGEIVRVTVGRPKDSDAIRVVRSGGSDLTVVGEVTWAAYTEAGGGIKIGVLSDFPMYFEKTIICA